MCGIGGVLRIDGAPVDPGVIEPLVEAMAHRGPDGRGRHVDGPVALGHLRLSILDPSPAGAQPMCRGGTVLIHNGEVYNYLELAEELRAAGETFSTGTDTEVILAAYRVWGLDAIARFNGMFAFAIWDPDRRRLVLARDRVGVKPLYVRRTSRSIAFASEVRALVAGRPVDPGDDWCPEPHLGAVHDFLSGGRLDHSTMTFVAGVTALPPAHILVVEDGVERLVRYWGPPALADDARATVRGADLERDRERVEEFRALFDSAVRLRLRSDVPIGTCLSGGMDSSSIVVTIAELLRTGGRAPREQAPRFAFNARFPEDGIDESRFAALVAERSDLRLFYQTPAGMPLLATMLPILQAQGEPYGGASINAQHAVMEAAHGQALKVLLDGQGADELLGGYLVSSGVRVAGLAWSGHPFDAAGELRAQVAAGTLSAGGAIAGAVRGGLPSGALEVVRTASMGRFGVRCRPELRREPPLEVLHREPGTLLARHLWQGTIGYGLPALLRYEDRNSMAFGLEARVPFLDVRLIELANGLPDRLRIGGGVTKAVLRLAMRDRLPQPVLDRRDKIGFVAPQRRWLLAGRDEAEAILRGGQIVGRGWVAAGDIERILDAVSERRRAMEQLWRLVVVEAWLRTLWPDGAPVAGRDVWDRAVDAAAAAQRQPAVAVAGSATPEPAAS